MKSITGALFPATRVAVRHVSDSSEASHLSGSASSKLGVEDLSSCMQERGIVPLLAFRQSFRICIVLAPASRELPWPDPPSLKVVSKHNCGSFTIGEPIQVV
jgi:hypothetical protein